MADSEIPPSGQWLQAAQVTPQFMAEKPSCSNNSALQGGDSDPKLHKALALKTTIPLHVRQRDCISKI